MTQRTVLIWDDQQYGISFWVAQGDLRHLDGHYIDSPHHGLESVEVTRKKSEELEEILTDEGQFPRGGLLEDFPTTAVLEGAFVIVCGRF